MARQRDEQKYEQILETATKLFSQNGYHATSIQDIVANSGLSVGTIYLYFSNKEEIFDALIESGLEAFSVELFNDIDRDLPPDEIAESLVSAILDTIYNNNRLVTILTNELGFQKKLQGVYSKVAEIISEKYMDSSDTEKLYDTLKMTKKEFFALVTILIAGLSNAMRVASSSKGGIIRFDDVKMVMHEIILKSLLERIEDN